MYYNLFNFMGENPTGKVILYRLSNVFKKRDPDSLVDKFGLNPI